MMNKTKDKTVGKAVKVFIIHLLILQNLTTLPVVIPSSSFFLFLNVFILEVITAS
jgi:hypothetical protein